MQQDCIGFTLIIDDIVLPDGTTYMQQLGGGGGLAASVQQQQQTLHLFKLVLLNLQAAWELSVIHESLSQHTSPGSAF